ncbi:hypothetical protein PRIC1_007227 [Phytophthora ramorum]
MPRRTSPALSFNHVSAHTSMEDATLALHSLDASLYQIAYNYGATGNGKVYRCVSHCDCPRRLRIVRASKKEDAKTATLYNLETTGDHGTKISNKKRKGIDLSVKGDVDALLAGGSSAKKCRLALQEKYADQPTILAKIPDENMLKNRLTTLRRNEKSVLQTSAAQSGRRSSRGRKEAESDEEEQLDNKEEVEGDGEQEEEEEEEEEEDQFDKTKLMDELATLPGRAVFWSILKRRMVVDEKTNSIVTEWITGQVVGWVTSDNAPTKWTVRFSDGEKRRFELKELVDEIRASVDLGLNVTGRPLSL